MATSVEVVAEQSFPAAFGGPAVELGRMNAKDFAPSLFATATLIESAADVVFPGRNAIAVQVNANFRQGSFAFVLLVVAQVAIAGQHLLLNLSISDIDVLLQRIGFRRGPDTSLFSILQRAGGRPIARIEAQANGSANIFVQGDNNIVLVGDVPADVARLLLDSRVRTAIPDIVAPLAKPGILLYRAGEADEVSGSPPVVITKEDLPALQLPASVRTELTNDVSRQALELLAPNFVEGNKWRVAQGGAPFWVKISDAGFLDSVNQGGRPFRKGDYLIVDLRVRSYATSEGLQVEHEVEHVADHQQAPNQLRLL